MRTSSAIGSRSSAGRSSRFFHPELRPPSAEVIVANDVVAEELRDACERVPQNSAADVADVHRFRHVGRTEIDHDFSWSCRSCHAEPVIAQNLAGFLSDRFRAQSEINKAGTGHARRLAPFTDIEMLENFRGDISRLLAALLAKDERSVALVIAESRI